MVGVTTAGLTFALWGYRTLGRSWAHAFEPSTFLRKEKDVLVTWGPYHYVRNPIYLGAFTFLIAVSVVAANWLLLVPNLVAVSLVYGQINGEEVMLVDRFGDKYRDYMKLVPRFFPKLKSGQRDPE